MKDVIYTLQRVCCSHVLSFAVYMGTEFIVIRNVFFNCAVFKYA